MRLKSVSKLQLSRSSILANGWMYLSSYQAIDTADSGSKLASLIADFRKGQYAKPRILTNYRDTGALSSVGTTTAPSYNTGTGAGVAYRVDASNQSGVQFAAAANKVYELDLESGPNGIITRSGTSLAGSIAHNGLAANVRQKVYLASIGPLVFIAANANNTTCSYTLHSIREVDISSMEVANFADLFTFTRAGTATYIDKDGKMQVAANDVPRFDYSNDVRQLLLEGPATNLATYSDDASNVTGWGAGVNTIGGFPDPFGGNTAAEYTAPNSATVTTKIITIGGRTAGVATRFYWYSAENYTWNFLFRNNTTATLLNGRAINMATFSTNPVGYSDTVAGWTVKYLGNNWVEVIGIQTTGMSDNDAVAVYYGQTGANYNGRKFRIAKFDFFPEPRVSSHIVVPGNSAVTRAADMCRLSPMAEAILQRTEASALVQFRAFVDPQNPLGAILGTASVDNSTLISNSSTVANRGQTYNGTVSLIANGPIPLTSPSGVGVAFSASGRSVAANGISATDTNTIGARSQAYLGRGGNGATVSGRYDQFVIWIFRTTDVSLQAKAVAYV